MNSRERSPSKTKCFACWDEVDSWLWKILKAIENKGFTEIYGISRGGLVPAVWLSYKLDIPLLKYEKSRRLFHDKVLIIDDVIDTGKTYKTYKNYIKNQFVTLIRKPWSPEILFSAKETEHWIKFPWEN